jgi:hypothetical protein
MLLIHLTGPVCQTYSQTALSATVSGITGDGASSALPTSAPNSSLPKQSCNAEKVHCLANIATSPPPKMILALKTGEQDGERDVAVAVAAQSKAVVDYV